MQPELKQGSSPRATLVACVLLILALSRWVPFGPQLLYPFTLLSTWVHEMGHGLTALLCGGQFVRLEIFADASGRATSAVLPGLSQGLVAAGGLLGPPLFGAICLLLAPRLARPLLYLLAAALLLSLPLWVRTQVGWLSVGGLGLGIAVLARILTPAGQLFVAELIGLLMAFDTLARSDYLFTASAHVGGVKQPSDVAAMASALGGSYLFWGGLVGLLSALLLSVGLYSVLRSGKRPSA